MVQGQVEAFKMDEKDYRKTLMSYQMKDFYRPEATCPNGSELDIEDGWNGH